MDALKIKEYKAEDGRILAGDEICEIHSSVSESMENKKDSQELLMQIVYDFSTKHGICLSDKVENKYDALVGICHFNDEDIQEILNRTGNVGFSINNSLEMRKVAEIYYAKTDRLHKEDILFMINHCSSPETMREVHRALRNGTSQEDLLKIVSEKDAEKLSSLVWCLNNGANDDFLRIASGSKLASTIVLLCLAGKKGISSEEMMFIVESENRLVEQYSPLLNKGYDMFKDVHEMIQLTMYEGIDAAKGHINSYIAGIRDNLHNSGYNFKAYLNQVKSKIL